MHWNLTVTLDVIIVADVTLLYLQKERLRCGFQSSLIESFVYEHVLCGTFAIPTYWALSSH